MNQVEIKSGLKSSELYLTIGNTVAGMAVLLGYLTPQQADDFVKAVVTTLGGLMVIISTVVYVVGRIKLKQTAVQSSTPTPAVPVVDQVTNLEVEPQFIPR